jgi:hypothetical protein
MILSSFPVTQEIFVVERVPGQKGATGDEDKNNAGEEARRDSGRVCCIGGDWFTWDRIRISWFCRLR